MNSQPNQTDPGKGTGAASLVLGIIGLCTGWAFGLGAVLGIVGIVLAAVSGNKSSEAGLNRNGLSTGGLVCSIIALVSGAGCLICTLCTAGTAGTAGLAGMY